MNVLHMRYAVEVARSGSINKAAERLLVAQPNLSRAVKELESDLGIVIFERSSRGMCLTPEGADFIARAEKLLKQIEDVEMQYKQGSRVCRCFSVSVPRASYVAEAFAAFSATLGEGEAELYYKETNSQRTLNNVLQGDYRLGIVRYGERYDRYYKTMLEEKGLSFDLIMQFRYRLIVRADSPLAAKEDVTLADLGNYIEIAHADPYVPSLPLEEVRRAELSGDISRRIFVFERASQFELLARNPETFMWVSPMPQELLTRYGLVQLECSEATREYRDVLVHRRDYRLTELDDRFITELIAARRRVQA